MKEYEVPIVYTGQSNYIVTADSPADAESKARARFNNGEASDTPASDYEKVERVGSIEELPPAIFYVDIPTPETVKSDDGSWVNLSTFNSKPEAVEYIRRHIGPCDDEGRVCLITQGTK